MLRRFDELDVNVKKRYWTTILQGEWVWCSLRCLCLYTVISHLLVALEGLCQNLGSLEITTLAVNEKRQFRNTVKVCEI